MSQLNSELDGDGKLCAPAFASGCPRAKAPVFKCRYLMHWQFYQVHKRW